MIAESDKAKAAYRVYRDAGPGRTRSAAARALGHASTPGAWKRWARDYEWERRCSEWDARVDSAALDGIREGAAQTTLEWHPLLVQLHARLMDAIKTDSASDVGKLTVAAVRIDVMIRTQSAVGNRAPSWEAWSNVLREIAAEHGTNDDGSFH